MTTRIGYTTGLPLHVKELCKRWDIKVDETILEDTGGPLPSLLERRGFFKALHLLWDGGILVTRAKDLGDDPLTIAYLRAKGITLCMDQEQGDDPIIRKHLEDVISAERALARMPSPDAAPAGRKPYGFHKEELPVIALMKRLRRERVGAGQQRSFMAVARELNRLGIPSRTGKEWRQSSVQNVLKGPIAKGVRVADFRAQMDELQG